MNTYLPIASQVDNPEDLFFTEEELNLIILSDEEIDAIINDRFNKNPNAL